MKKRRILFVCSGLTMPLNNIGFCKRYELLSNKYYGDIIAHTSPNSFHIKKIADFKFHPISYNSSRPIARKFLFFIKAIMKAIRIFREENKYDVIISTDPLLSGITANIIGLLTRRKTVVEVNGSFESAFKYNQKNPSLSEKYKEKVSYYIIPLILRMSSMVRLLYPTQLSTFSEKISKRESNVAIFSEFVPIEMFINTPHTNKGYILLLGFPWYLKGVDVLIKAFNCISKEYPEYKLKIVGWNPKGKEFFEELIENKNRVELCAPVDYVDVPDLMAGCSLYVLASRTEAMGRVLLEAMACEKPIIASRVDGVPSIIKDGYNGLLFESENVEDLAEKMRIILRDNHFAETLAKNGFDYVSKNLSEKHYLTHFCKMINHTLKT